MLYIFSGQKMWSCAAGRSCRAKGCDEPESGLRIVQLVDGVAYRSQNHDQPKVI